MLLPRLGGKRRRAAGTPRRRGSGDPRTNRRGGARGPATMGWGRFLRTRNRGVRRFPDLGATSGPAPQRTGSRRLPRTTRHLRNLPITSPRQPPVASHSNMVHKPRGRAAGALHLAPTPPLQHHTRPSPSNPQRSRGPRAPRPNARHRRGRLNHGPPDDTTAPDHLCLSSRTPEGRAFRPTQPRAATPHSNKPSDEPEHPLPGAPRH